MLGDESWFDSVRTVRGWKSSYYIWECPPLSALVVDRDWYDNHYAARPALAAAGTFRKLLTKHGVTTRAAGLGRASADAVVLASVQSRTLQFVLTEMDRQSDNFLAEMLLKTLGAERGGAGPPPPARRSSAATSRRRASPSTAS